MCHMCPPALKANINLQQEIKGDYFITIRTSDTAQLYDTNWIIFQMLRPVTVPMEITSQGSLGSSNIWNTCLQPSVGKLTNAAARDLPRGQVYLENCKSKIMKNPYTINSFLIPGYNQRITKPFLSRKWGKYRTLLSLPLPHFFLVSCVAFKAIIRN